MYLFRNGLSLGKETDDKATNIPGPDNSRSYRSKGTVKTKVCLNYKITRIESPVDSS